MLEGPAGSNRLPNSVLYADWHLPLLDRLFGGQIELHHDLYELTHAHRIEHDGGRDDELCTAWPSPPSRAPIWSLIVQMVGAHRFLEVGTGVGYTAALMASAGGPNCHVDTIESDPTHVAMAEAALKRKRLASRVNIIQGDANEILGTLIEPYHVVFEDGGGEDLAEHLKRLTRPGGVGTEIKGRVRLPLIEALERLNDGLDRGIRSEEFLFAEARAAYDNVLAEALTSKQ